MIVLDFYVIEKEIWFERVIIILKEKFRLLEFFCGNDYIRFGMDCFYYWGGYSI